jgi:hypothetical protein
MDKSLLSNNITAIKTGKTEFDYAIKSLPTFNVNEINLEDSALDCFEIATLNTDYAFLRVGKDSSGQPIWRVLQGRAEMLGEIVLLFGINEDTFKPNSIKKDGRLGICLTRLDDYPWHTSRIFRLAIL